MLEACGPHDARGTTGVALPSSIGASRRAIARKVDFRLASGIPPLLVCPARSPSDEPPIPLMLEAGMLTDRQKSLVQESWSPVVPIADTAAELFYGRLFELDPSLKSLFVETSMKEQGRKLT